MWTVHNKYSLSIDYRVEKYYSFTIQRKGLIHVTKETLGLTTNMSIKSSEIVQSYVV